MASTPLRAHSGGQGLRLEIKPCPKMPTTLPKDAHDRPCRRNGPAEERDNGFHHSQDEEDVALGGESQIHLAGFLAIMIYIIRSTVYPVHLGQNE